jgi:hypothetical protein
VLGHCAALAHLNLGCNGIGPDGAESLAGMLGQCAALAHLNLCPGIAAELQWNRSCREMQASIFVV